ncbi:MAG: AEC family transporter, partial [Oscillospiraceae bacterium]
AAAGVIFSLSGLSIPSVLSKPLVDLASCATPLTMLMLGAQFNLSSAATHLRLALSVSAIKLILLPAVWVAVAVALGFTGNDLCAVFIIYAAPTAVTTVMMAENMGADGRLAGEIVLIATFCSMPTLVLGTLLLQGLGLI